ncbi:MAG: hypothetical protein ACRD15_13750 [Vicinamibacterales bacterium]
MNDHELEHLLRRVRPAGPPADLRSRILCSAAGQAARLWPWAAAAAALLVTTVALHAGANRSIAGAVTVPPANEEILAGLTNMLGGDADARAKAELILASEQARVARNAASSSPDRIAQTP